MAINILSIIIRKKWIWKIILMTAIAVNLSYICIYIGNFSTNVRAMDSKKPTEVNEAHIATVQENKMKRILSSRLAEIKSSCKRHNNTNPLDFKSLKKDDWPWLYISHRYKIIYCQTPKVGSTNWLRIFEMMEGITNSSSTFHEVHYVPFMLLWHLPEEEMLKVLEEYTKFMVIRDPIERIFSAYKDKFLPYKNYGIPLFYYLSKKIVRFYRSANSQDQKGYPSFEEFIAYVTDSSKLSGEIKTHYSEPRHWQPQIELCYPCNIDYDYILHLENINEESDYMLSNLNVPSVLKYPKPLTNQQMNIKRRANDTKQFLLGLHIDNQHLQALYRYYKEDYEILDLKPLT